MERGITRAVASVHRKCKSLIRQFLIDELLWWSKRENHPLLPLLAKQQVSPEIRAEIESLLSWDLQAGAEIDCGPYRAVRVLGAGGMRTVPGM